MQVQVINADDGSVRIFTDFDGLIAYINSNNVRKIIVGEHRFVHYGEECWRDVPQSAMFSNADSVMTALNECIDPSKILDDHSVIHIIKKIFGPARNNQY